MFKKFTHILALAASVTALAFNYSFEANHPDAIYKIGEKAVITVTITDKDNVIPKEGTVKAVLDNFGPKQFTTQTWDLAKGNTFSIEGTMSEPGFLRLNVSSSGKDRKFWSVGFEPEKIKKGSPSPADFDAFWADAIKKLDETVPPDMQMVLQEERSKGAFNFYRISFATANNRRVYGYLSVPKDASATKKYPVRFQVPAAGNGNWTNNMSGQPNAVCMFICVYDYEPIYEVEEHKKKYAEMNERLQAKYGTGYATAGIAVSREEYFFYAPLLGINRAINWLAEQPYVDLRDFTYSGTSQGGGYGFYLAGLNHHFTKAVMYVPAITDTMGYLKGRQSGWPRIIESQRTAEAKASAEKFAPYFDGANFASRIQCPVRVAVGFSDTICAPCAVYAAYNEIPVQDKQIRHGLGMTHSCFGKFYSELGAWQTSGK